MNVLTFNTDNVPQDTRLPLFRMGAKHFQVEPIGDPAAFRQRWRMLQLDHMNVIHVVGSALRYRRDAAMIAADGEDRFTVHFYMAGGEVGELDGRAASCGPGGATLWDLARPLDMGSADETGQESVIVTLPRQMLIDAFGIPPAPGALVPDGTLHLAARQVLSLIDAAADLPDAAGPALARAVRDLFAMAIATEACETSAALELPLLQRMTNAVDAALAAPMDVGQLAASLGAETERVAAVAARFGGLALLVERRRLLAAYQALSDPNVADTVEQVAHRCGFGDLPQFSRSFRSVFHVSAGELRRRGRGRLPDWAGAYHVEQLYSPLRSST